jgi:hypothetical protein
MQVQEALRVMSLTLGNSVPSEPELLGVLNDCGTWFYGYIPWNFTKRETYLSVPAQITFSAATWTASSLTITQTAAFAAYSLIEGDKVEITGGTGATTGFYEISSSTSGTLVLKSSLAAGNLATGDLAGTLHVSGRCPMPSDLGDIEEGYPTLALGFAQSFELTALAKVHEWRALFTGGASRAYIGAIVWGRATAGGAPTPRLEIAPEIVEGRASAFVLVYRGKFAPVTSATIEFELPTYCEPAFKEALRHFARGTYEEDEGTLDQRLAALCEGPLMEMAMRQDAMFQPDYGRIEGGAVQGVRTRGPFQNFEILNPT